MVLISRCKLQTSVVINVSPLSAAREQINVPWPHTHTHTDTHTRTYILYVAFFYQLCKVCVSVCGLPSFIEHLPATSNFF